MEYKRKPDWLKIKLQYGKNSTTVEKVLQRYKLNTVCQEAACPNRMECYNKKSATFMIMGEVCTRNCRFCNVSGGSPGELDPDEPVNIARGVQELGLKHVVITSVTRDDLPDGGAGHFAETVTEIRRLNPDAIIEVLIPDFMGNRDALVQIIRAEPAILNHNVETVPRLYPEVRPQAIYRRSLKLLLEAKEIAAGKKLYTKSGIMVGLGESAEEVEEVLQDLRESECDLLTIGQYLAPSTAHFPVQEYISPEIFETYKEKALLLGFHSAASAPFVRSSYNAGEFFEALSGR